MAPQSSCPFFFAGYREACSAARHRLEQVARNNSGNSAAFRKDLLNIARTTLSSKILTHDKDHFAELAVDAVLRLKGSTDMEAIHIIKKPGGTLKVWGLHSCAPAFLLGPGGGQ